MPDTLTIKTERGRVCPHTFAFILDNVFRRLIQNPKKIVGEYIKAGDTAVDLGCGPGFFSIDMARMVGAQGRVIAADLQTHMISKVKRKAAKHGLLERLAFHQCAPHAIGLNQKADFILAYYMVHETPDAKAFLAEVKGLLKKGGLFLVVEPRMHVKQRMFDTMVMDAAAVGLKAIDFPKGKGGRSVLFQA